MHMSFIYTICTSEFAPEGQLRLQLAVAGSQHWRLFSEQVGGTGTVDKKTTGFPGFETGPKGPELEGKQVEKKSKAAQTNPKKLIRRTFLPTSATRKIQ